MVYDNRRKLRGHFFPYFKTTRTDTRTDTHNNILGCNTKHLYKHRYRIFQDPTH